MFYWGIQIQLCSYRASTMVEGCQAGRLGHLLQYMHKYNAESLKQGSERFNSIVKTFNIADLCIVYLCLHCTKLD